WMLLCAARIELHYACGIRDRFDTRKRKHDADEASPVFRERSMQRFQMSERLTEMRQAKQTQGDHDEGSRNRNEKCETDSLFRSQQVEESNHEDGSGSEFLRVRQAEILKRGNSDNAC